MSVNLQNATLRISAGRIDQFPSDAMPQVAFSGRSNVGKSSLINTLLCRKSLARVSSAPGKTITVNFYDIDKKLFFVDLPGYGFAKRTREEQKVWSGLTDGFFTANRNIDRLCGVIQLIDSRVGPTEDDIMMLDFLNESKIPYVVVATKIDKLNATEKKANLGALRACRSIDPKAPIVPFSSLKNLGRNELWKEITLLSGVSL